ncbi:type II toxin-antitoxin system RelE/ParE family toxin [Thioalkalivibrio sp.]|uniref:type II toxin-antitoxin system RelE/ParE family toxin n=1 Tax=Thioalkalivibrio sp. TaxID=2093813 RepID=UPI00397696F6
MHRARVALELPCQYDLDSIWNRDHIQQVAWTVLLHSDFDAELAALDELLQDELLAHARLLAEFGPHLGRPTVDTLKGSRHPNMKELRFGWQGGVWRVAFAFDPQRQAILLVGGDKGGADQKRFYRRLIAVADDRYDGHLTTLKAAGTKETKRGKKTR